MKKIEYTLDQIDSVAKQLLVDIADSKVVTFTGGLGAGKTTLIKAILKTMGVKEVVISPTFTYFNQYQTLHGLMVYHFDLYRLKSLQEFEALGFFEYLYQPESITFIEWPEIIDEFLQDFVCRIKLSVLSSDQRLLEYDYINKGTHVLL